MSPEQFIEKWQHSTRQQRSATQPDTHKLRALFGGLYADSDGSGYTCEDGAKTTGGNREFKQERARYLRQQLSVGKIASVKFCAYHRDRTDPTC